jgi:hypothetical protein
MQEEDAENDAVLRLAARLAPALEEAEELLALPPEFARQNSTTSPTGGEDDDMDQELQDLATSEDLLRRELEDIQNFSNLFSFSTSPEQHGSSPTNTPASPTDEDWQSPQRRQSPTLEKSPRTPLAFVVEADLVNGEQDTAPEQRYLPPIRIPTPPSASKSPQTPRSRRQSGGATSPSLLLRMGSQPVPYHTEDHQTSLGVEKHAACGWYTVDLTRHVVPHVSPYPAAHGLQEICLALPPAKLQPWFVGLQQQHQQQTSSAPPLPVRTLTMRLRPDVLCGAVMDAAAQSLHDAKVWKRQGGHLQALVASSVEEALYFVVDIQVVTFKTLDCRRLLLIRIYHADTKFPDHNEDEAASTASAMPLPMDSPVAEAALDPAASLHLREACALFQRMEYPSTPSKALHRPAQSPTMSDRESMSQSVRSHLLDHYQACPSVKAGQITLPCLNPTDWPVVQASWPWVYSLWSELETRDLTYTTLYTTTAFGKFPSLSTLDVHFCSQIRRLSRETMVVQLLRSASDLEDYARQAEYACANMISLLQPTYQSYELEPPALPEPVPLTSYPLDFVPPQTEYPPWGRKVMEALNQVQAASSTNTLPGSNMDNLFTGEAPMAFNQLDKATAEDSLKRAAQAVDLVISAFQQQDDEEKGARLARKNVQVMDRLAKMEEHQIKSIATLINSDSPKAQRASDELFTKTKIRQVPLLKWSVVVGSSTGTCWVTAGHIIFSTQLIPVVGSLTVQVFAWKSISVAKTETTPSLLNPLSVAIQIQSDETGDTLCSFRPSVGGVRLYSFLQIIKIASKGLERT